MTAPGSVRAAWAKCSYLSPLLAAPYDPGAWRDVGRALAMALLDMAADDAARLDDVRTTRTLDGVRNWLRGARLEKTHQGQVPAAAEEEGALL